MSLEDAVAQLADKRHGDDVIHTICEIGGLAQAISYLYIVRNGSSEGMSPEVIVQRRAILDICIQLLRNRIKKDARERLVPLLEKWEKD